MSFSTTELKVLETTVLKAYERAFFRFFKNEDRVKLIREIISHCQLTSPSAFFGPASIGKITEHMHTNQDFCMFVFNLNSAFYSLWLPTKEEHKRVTDLVKEIAIPFAFNTSPSHSSLLKNEITDNLVSRSDIDDILQTDPWMLPLFLLNVYFVPINEGAPDEPKRGQQHAD